MGYFQVVAITNKVATNILTWNLLVDVCTNFCYIYTQKWKLLGNRVYIFSALVGIAKQFSGVIIPIYTSLRNVWKFQSLYFIVAIWHWYPLDPAAPIEKTIFPHWIIVLSLSHIFWTSSSFPLSPLMPFYCELFKLHNKCWYWVL